MSHVKNFTAIRVYVELIMYYCSYDFTKRKGCVKRTKTKSLNAKNRN
jgi:hypothetical protein